MGWLLIRYFTFFLSLTAWLAIPFSQVRAQEIYPPLDSPKLRFESSGVPDTRVPALPGLSSPWRVAQWAKSEALDPSELRHRDNARRDPTLGDPVASEVTPDGQSALAIYRSNAGYIYELRSQNGIRQPGGSSNLFLTASPLTPNATFDSVISYDLDATLSEATATYKTPEGKEKADVMAHVFTGFTLNMHGVAGSPNYDVFLQIGHSSTRQEPSGFFECQIAKQGQTITVGFGANPLGAQRLEFASDHGGLHHLHYVINDYLRNMLARTPSCRDANGAQSKTSFSAAAHDVRNWKLGGIYLGLETHNRDARPEATDHEVHGAVTVAFQIANLHVKRKSGKSAEPR
jgi:hypothetical protein